MKAPAPSDKSKQKSVNASEKKDDESKVRRKQTSREEAKEDKILVKRIIIERSATERKEGKQENPQKFQDGRTVYAVPCLRRSSHCQRVCRETSIP